MTETSEHWADLILRVYPSMPTLEKVWHGGFSQSRAPHGAYAEHYGHVVQFFVEFYEEAGELALSACKTLR